MIFKKGQGLPLNTVIIGILVILVLVILSAVVSSFFTGSFSDGINSCASVQGECYNNSPNSDETCVFGDTNNKIIGQENADCTDKGPDYRCCIPPGKVKN